MIKSREASRELGSSSNSLIAELGDETDSSRLQNQLEWNYEFWGASGAFALAGDAKTNYVIKGKGNEMELREACY